ncbi:MAG: hypothetical protein ACKVJH_05645 [Flavobacteriales bacterium]
MKNSHKFHFALFSKSLLSAVLFAATVFLTNSHAQCEAGEVAIEWTITTDAWGYEMYWEMTPSGLGCGAVEFIASGGNSADVGCDGAGNNGSGGNYYGSNGQFTAGPFCVTDGASIDLIHVDSYGDGGSDFILMMDGVLSGIFDGTGYGNTWSFTAGESLFVDHDVPCDAAPIEPNGLTVMVSNASATVQPGEMSPPAAPSGSCNLSGSWCTSDGNVTASSWLSFTAGTTDPLTIMACSDSTTFDTQLALYRVVDCGDFSTYELVASNDDACAGWASIMYTSCLEVGVDYLIQMDGWAGYQGVAEVTVFSTDSYDLNADTQQRNVTCPLDKDFGPNGFLLAYVSNGGSDFDCLWSGPDGFSSDENWIFGLSPGTYDATITTTCGTEFSLNRTIVAPEPWSVDSDVVEASCETSGDGEISIDVSGATAPYAFSWSGPEGFDSQEEDLFGLAPGTYQLVITDGNGCSNPLTAFVSDAGYGDFAIGNDTIICEDEPLLIYGPIGLDYEWQDGSTNQFFYVAPGDFAPGTYSIILNATTEEGCAFADALILTVHSCASGISEAGLEGAVLYPHPASDEVFMDLEVTGNPWELRIIDAAGRLVHQGQWAGGTAPLLQVGGWPSGLYQVQFLDENRSFTRKLTVQH